MADGVGLNKPVQAAKINTPVPAWEFNQQMAELSKAKTEYGHWQTETPNYLTNPRNESYTRQIKKLEGLVAQNLARGVDMWNVTPPANFNNMPQGVIKQKILRRLELQGDPKREIKS